VEKGLRFEITLDPDVPATMHTDEQRLQQVLRNLLSNAVKFTDAGAVRLAISRADGRRLRSDPVRRSSTVLRFSVTDTGVGIGSDLLPTVFEAFQQGDGTASRRYGGTGLGLSISREIAELLGGELHATSELGRGSTFTLYLPLVGPSGTAAPSDVDDAVDDAADETVRSGLGWVEAVGAGGASRPSHSPSTMDEAAAAGSGAGSMVGGPAGDGTAGSMGEPPGQAAADPDRVGDMPETRPGDLPAGPAELAALLPGKQVLIVDDDVRNVFTLTAALEQQGMSVRYAENGQDAIAMLNHEPDVDLLLMDIMMPGMDGNATTRTIRARPEFADLPIIALTAKAMAGDQESSLLAGASDYVTKPVDVDHLLRVIADLGDR